MSEALLTLEGVTVGYSGDIDVLREVSLSVTASSITGLIGLNGAGKSTLMKTIGGFLKPKSGRIVYDGTDITGIAPHHLLGRQICYIPQESSLFQYMSVEQNLRLPLEGRKGARDALEEKLADVVVRFPMLAEKFRVQAGDLSGGQQKSLEFAKAYLLRPRLCLIDEPSIGLAPLIAREVFGWIDMFARSGMAILLVDHNVRRVVKMASHIYVLSLGEITASGRREEFQGDLHEQVRAWLGVSF
ncbi:MAG: ABC transporter ATP-binding protein [Acetobacteraceae bacterium]